MTNKLPFEEFIASSGYIFSQENSRYNFTDVSIREKKMNRGLCKAGVDGDVDISIRKKIKSEVYDSLLPSTLRGSAPITDISEPSTGHYFSSPKGVYFDAYVGVGQRLVDENHPNFKKMISKLIENNALLRREVSTNDFIISSSESGIITPQQLAKLVIRSTSSSFPNANPYKVYFSSSGSSAIESSMKIACRYIHAQIINNYGYELEAKLMSQFGIKKNEQFNHPEDKDPLYEDYPFYFITAKNAFHGRSFGALALTNVRPVHKRGYPALTRVKRIEFNKNKDSIKHLIDQRCLPEILESKGGIEEVVSNGRIPKELVAGFVIEPFQGEGGYQLANKEWLQTVVNDCKRFNISVISDEVQTFCRTGKVFALEHFNVTPDIIAISKASVVGMTIASERYAKHMPLGWHSSTWDGGKVFDNNYAWTVLNTYLNYEDDHFEGMTYMENQRVKSEYIKAMFSWLKKKHPALLMDFSGIGGMWGFSVKHRDEICKTAWEYGLKLLSCGVTKEVSSIRALFLSDVLTKEINCFARLLDKTMATVTDKHTLD